MTTPIETITIPVHHCDRCGDALPLTVRVTPQVQVIPGLCLYCPLFEVPVETMLPAAVKAPSRLVRLTGRNRCRETAHALFSLAGLAVSCVVVGGVAGSIIADQLGWRIHP